MVPEETCTERAGVVFPATIDPQRYHRNYVRYVANAFAAAGVPVEFAGDSTPGQCMYEVDWGGRRFIVDYNDYTDLPECSLPDLPRFKFSFCAAHRHVPGLYPFSPISVLDWPQYDRARQEVRYGGGERVFFIQTPHHGDEGPTDNWARRLLLQRVIPEAFGSRADTAFYPLGEYWRCVDRALVRVFAPGSRNDMLDRGHAQYLGLGCCTVSPRLSTVLPWWEPLVPGTHYVPCADDYSDVVDVIRWCDGHRAECVRIGRAAAALFERCSTPVRLVAWVRACLGGGA